MSQQIQITGGAKVRNLEGVLTGTSGVVNSVPLGAANGVATLDSGGKVPVSQLPSSVVTYLGTWNAATNTPTLVNGTGDAGDMYICNVAGTVNFGAGPITFAVGDWVLYGSGTWQKSNGQNGTVTSVGLSTNGGAITIGNSPITTSGVISANFNGTNLQYVNGAGNLTTFPTLITSIGLSMPSAFSVANSPLTANGTIAVTGAGYASQYIRGDGTLADFPSSGGGGSSVSYYLNGGTSQGTIGGTTYYEMSKTADTGTGVDFAKTGDGLIVAFLTDANDPAQLNIPAGNWNYEIYASMSANGGTPQMYAELYKYDGTTFTLISTSTNEILYDGTNLNLYTFGMTVPATTLTLTDRLAIKLYATNSGGKTTTVHTQDSHLCQVITTFSTGITALNGLTAQVQYFATGTSGTDFNISSTTATHTFNIPDASATARGLITTGTQTIAGAKTFSSVVKTDAGLTLKDGYYPTPATGYVGLASNGVGITILLKSGSTVYNNNFQFPNASNDYNFPNATGTIALTSDIPSLAGYVTLATTQTITGAKTFSGGVTLTSSVTTNNLTFANSGFFLTLQPPTLSVNRTVTFADITGTIAMLEGTQTFTGAKTFTATSLTLAPTSGGGTLNLKQDSFLGATNGYTSLTSSGSDFAIIAATGVSTSKQAVFSLSSLGAILRTYTLPDASGTIALVGGSGVGTVTSVAALTIGTTGTDLSSSVANSTTTPVITLNVPTASATNRGALSSADWTTFNNKQGTITLTTTGSSGAATFVGNTLNIPNYGSALSGYLPLTGGILTGNTFITNGSTFRTRLRADAARIDFVNYAESAYVGGFIEALTLNLNTLTNNPIATGTGTVTLGGALNGTSATFNSGITSVGGSNQEITASATGDFFPRLKLIRTAGTTKTNRNYSFDLGSTGNLTLEDNTAPATRLTIDASGNLGLGVTPSAWYSTWKAIEIGGADSNVAGNGTGPFRLLRNAYIDAGGTWIYKNTGEASFYQQSTGNHIWFTAPSGTAGNAITFTQAMTLTASGRLLIGTPTEASYMLDVNGTGRFSGNVIIQNTSDTYGLTLAQSNALNAGWGQWADTSGNYKLSRYGGGSYSSPALTITLAGAATFSSSVTAQALDIISASGVGSSTASGLARFITAATTPAISIGQSSNARRMDLYSYVINVTGEEFNLTTIDSQPIKLNTAATLRMIITGSGNVGIGTISPVTIFNIVSGVRGIPASSGTSTANASIRLRGVSNGVLDIGELSVSQAGSYWLQVHDQTDQSVNYNLALQPNGGNVLIGTTTDSGYKLDVNGTGRFSGVLEINSGNINTGNNLSLAWNSTSGASIQSFNSKPLNINPLGNAINFGGAATFSSSVTATSFFESSSIKGKDIIATNPLLALDIDVIKYTRKNDESKDIRYGYSAEQIHSLMPELTDKDVTAVKYLDVHTILIAQLQQEIKELKAKMN